jgi:phosphatidylserine/phosphatidylglycerophosphate/cardiolipin synthase-like enzyme
MPQSFLQRVCALLLLLTSTVSFADQLIIEPDMGRAPIANYLESAKHSVDLVIYGFTDDTLLSVLLRQQQQGKLVRVIMEQRPYKNENQNEKTLNTFKKHKLAWQGNIKPFRFIHQKTILIDDRSVLVMTFNFTKSSFKNQRNFGLIIDNPEQVKAINQLFNADWNHQPIRVNHSSLIISPDNSRAKLIELIQQTKSTLQIYAQSVNDNKVIDALTAAARRGVKIEILTSNPLRKKQANALHSTDINLHRSKKLYIHAKVFIFDHQKAVIGSINLTRASLDDNRELAVITEDTNVIKQLNDVFTRDWNNTESISHGSHIRSASILTEKNVKAAIKFMQRVMKSVD